MNADCCETSNLGLDPGPPSRKNNQEYRRKEAHRRSFPRRGQSLRYRLDRWPPVQSNALKLPVLHCPHHLILPQGSDVRSVLPDGHVISSIYAGWSGVGNIDLACLLQFELALYADDTAFIARSRKPTLLVSYLESYLNDNQRCLSDWRIAISVSMSSAITFARAGRRFVQPQTVTVFGETIEWDNTTRYLGVTLDRRLTWSPHIDQVRNRTAQKKGTLCPLPNGKSDLSNRKVVLLYKQLICPIMDYSCPTLRSAARSGVRTLQVLQSKCLRSSTGGP